MSYSSLRYSQSANQYNLFKSTDKRCQLGQICFVVSNLHFIHFYIVDVLTGLLQDFPQGECKVKQVQQLQQISTSSAAPTLTLWDWDAEWSDHYSYISHTNDANNWVIGSSFFLALPLFIDTKTISSVNIKTDLNTSERERSLWPLLLLRASH